MPKASKTGPPYTDVPNEIYVVATNPWGMHDNPRDRDQADFNRIASWARFALQQAAVTGGSIPTVECIYAMGTRDEIILQFPESTNVFPLLGEHRWANFSKLSASDDSRSTRIFLYNWKNNGDPAKHNWSENFPKNLPLDTVPAKTPYPVPSWTSPPPTLTNFVLPLPHPPNLNHERNPDEGQQLTPPLPVPGTPMQPNESGIQPMARDLDSVSTSLFRPYEPPSQHPSHAQLLSRSQAQCIDPSSSKAFSPTPKFMKKLDPYEVDDDALDFIRLSNSEEDKKEVKEAKCEDIKPTYLISVKAENPEVKIDEGNDDVRDDVASSSGYQPSLALIDAFNSLHQQEQSPSPAATTGLDTVKTEENDVHDVVVSSSGYQPSQALIDAFNSLGHSEQTPPFVPPTRPSREFGASRGTTASPSSGCGSRLTPGTTTAVKREYEDGTPSMIGKRKKIKVEED